MWTITTMLFYSAMQNSSKTWQRRWQKVDKSQDNYYVQSLCSKCPPFARTHALKSFAPPINSHVYSRLFKAAPNFNQPLLQFVDGVDFPLVYTTLHDSTDLVINRIEIWTVWRPQIWRNEVWCFSTQNLYNFTRTVTLVLVLQSNVATKLGLSYSGKFSFLLWATSFWFRHWKNFKSRPTLPKLQ